MSKPAELQARSEFVGRIELYQTKFSAKERQIADYLIEHEDSLDRGTIYDLAREVGTSPATLVRFAKRLGYTGYADLKFHVLQGKLALPDHDIGIRSGDSINVFKQKAVQFTTKSLSECIMDTDNHAFERAIDLISHAKSLILVGNGSSSGIAQAGAGLFLSIGVRSYSVGDSLLLTRTSAYLTSKDVMLSISYNGYSKSSTDAMMIAKRAGAATILVTSCQDSLMSRYADVVLYTPARNAANALNISTTDICQLAILQTLQIGVWMHDPAACQKRSAEMFRLTELGNYDGQQGELSLDRVKQN